MTLSTVVGGVVHHCDGTTVFKHERVCIFGSANSLLGCRDGLGAPSFPCLPTFLPVGHPLAVALDECRPHFSCFHVLFTRLVLFDRYFSTFRHALVGVRFAVFAADRLQNLCALAWFRCRLLAAT